ncbi:DarT ssDNA thymidine ADP-ribosyltransferase family protein [Spirulina major CS-329]|uniref:DarT ssDNA thymidine ADP-ribosyltransferase family protein n=1 Tax=Spirulina TaxID=1154 RepID=UPI00232BF301|nr:MULTISPECIES: DarT ssDNA thymidine ADP-ribosyltransferase family protein [Spirulina]MDB9496307.1 DarT ssDNA thymidine ADP-ribosyltransferase family protein [Spirulina subsalsa CS-330]MDB9502597.1 DarT ssDNA thymidine ADP-ribosyltransferase family protein [Spirulina major CS-329]
MFHLKPRVKDMVKREIDGLYYITHVDNLISILQYGILSHAAVEAQGIKPSIIYNSSVIDRRKTKEIEGRSLWNFANLYFQPRNAMLYSLIRSHFKHSDLVILFLKKSILDRNDIFISNGNAAHQETRILPVREARQYFQKLKEQVDQEWWNDHDGSKRKLMAECLVPDRITPDYIQGIYVSTPKVLEKVKNRLKDQTKLGVAMDKIIISSDPKIFFKPNSRRRIKNISIVQGDMFFSQLQTLTVSVNCVGVMGKGLASTAKYRFPDVYVAYQDLCKSKVIKMGKPYVYKREISAFDDLRDKDLSDARNCSDLSTWFLLFPTKNHWRNQSSLTDIEQGMQWLVDNYKDQEIQSLAMPALGCGLGGLSWETVGPLMCRFLVQMDINCAVYLPSESEIPEAWVTPEFLLPDVK